MIKMSIEVHYALRYLLLLLYIRDISLLYNIIMFLCA